MPTPKIIPVIDIMGGQVVRAVGGRRNEYKPVRSVLTDSTEPGEVARALVAATGADCVYVADLDAIVHRRPDWASVHAAEASGAAVLLDGGFRTIADELRFKGPHSRAVLATETGTAELFRCVPLKYVVVSIDMRDGRVIDCPGWGDDPVEVFRRVVDLGAWEVQFLELTRVGTGLGAGTEGVVAACHAISPNALIAAGGGVRTWGDVQRLVDAGANAVLVASALHDGTLTLPRPGA